MLPCGAVFVVVGFIFCFVLRRGLEGGGKQRLVQGVKKSGQEAKPLNSQFKPIFKYRPG